jgi:hypothetical protein
MPEPEKLRDDLQLQPAEAAKLRKNFGEIRSLLRSKNLDIEDVIGLVTTRQIENATQQVTIRISEESVSQMNMVAFD